MSSRGWTKVEEAQLIQYRGYGYDWEKITDRLGRDHPSRQPSECRERWEYLRANRPQVENTVRSVHGGNTAGAPCEGGATGSHNEHHGDTRASNGHGSYPLPNPSEVHRMKVSEEPELSERGEHSAYDSGEEELGDKHRPSGIVSKAPCGDGNFVPIWLPNQTPQNYQQESGDSKDGRRHWTWWTAEEDAKLIEHIQAQKPDVQWHQIAEQLPGRDWKGCKRRWYRGLQHKHPDIWIFSSGA